MSINNHALDAFCIVEKLPNRKEVADCFLSRREVLRRIGISNTTMYKLISENRFPKQIKIGSCRTVVWSENAVNQWMLDQINGSAE